MKYWNCNISMKVKWFKWCHFTLRSVGSPTPSSDFTSQMKQSIPARNLQQSLNHGFFDQLNFTFECTIHKLSSRLTNFEFHSLPIETFLAVEVVLERKIIWCLKDQATYVIPTLFVELPSFTGWSIRYMYKIWISMGGKCWAVINGSFRWKCK